MTYRPRPSREDLVLAAVDLALSENLHPAPTEGLSNVGERRTLLCALLEALGVPDHVGARSYAREDLAGDLLDLGLTLDEADTSEVDGPRLRARLEDTGTVEQRTFELHHVRHTFDKLVRAAVESLPPSTVRRP